MVIGKVISREADPTNSVGASKVARQAPMRLQAVGGAGTPEVTAAGLRPTKPVTINADDIYGAATEGGRLSLYLQSLSPSFRAS
jgi:hypothetical protein